MPVDMVAEVPLTGLSFAGLQAKLAGELPAVDTQWAAGLTEDGAGMFATGALGIGQVVRGSERPFSGCVAEGDAESDAPGTSQEAA